MIQRGALRRLSTAAKLLVAATSIWRSDPSYAQRPAAPEPSEETVFAVKAGGAHSDNIRRVAVDAESGSYTAVGIIGDFRRARPRFDADISADVEQRNYSEEGLENDLYGTLDATIEFQLLPDRISWLVADSHGQGRTDAFLPESPENREQINIFATGPRFDIPLGSRTSLEIAATRVNTSYEETDFLDSDTERTELVLSRALTGRTEVALTAHRREIEYGVPGLDARLSAAYLSYSRDLVTGSAALALGTNRVNFGSRSDSAPYVELSWDRDVGNSSHVGVLIANQLRDAAESFRATSVIAAAERIDDVLVTADIYEQSIVGVSYDVVFGRSRLSMTLGRLEQQYETDAQLDNDQSQFDIELRRQISGSLEFGIGAYVAERTFDLSAQVDDDEGATIWLRKTVGRRLALDFGYQHDSRDGVRGTYDENTIRVIAEYYFRPPSES